MRQHEETSRRLLSNVTNLTKIIIKRDKNTTPIGYDDMTGEFNMRLKAARSWLNLYHKPSINTDKILTILL